MTLLLSFLACEEAHPCMIATVSVSGTDGVGIELEDQGQRLGARMVRPEVAVASLPVVVQIFGGWAPSAVSESSGVVPDGTVVVRPALADEGWGDGEDDRRGAQGRAAVATALRYATGRERDAGGCSIVDRAPEADPDRVVLFGMSNGGNLALATLADSALDVPELDGVLTWETPAGAQFVNHEFMGDDSLYAPGACRLDSGSAIRCDLPDLGFGAEEDERCFDLGGDGGCFGDVAFSGTVDETTGLRALSSTLLTAAELAGATAPDWSTPEESELFWGERDAARVASAVVARFPALRFMLLGSESDHAVPELEDHPHLFGFGQALLQAGAAWVRLNPGSTWSGLADENSVNAPLVLDSPEGWLLPEDAESPLRTPAGWGVSELTAAE